MNIELLRKHVSIYLKKLQERNSKEAADEQERFERIKYYQSWTKERIQEMSRDELYEYMSKLWAMQIWGNKEYYVDKIIEDNGLNKFREELSKLVWDKQSVDEKWNSFRKNVKGLGPAMTSEILAHVYPDQCIIWNRRALVALSYLGVKNLPVYNYQVTGKEYVKLSQICLEILTEFRKSIPKSNLITLDYFFWDELQTEKNLSAFKIESKVIEKDIANADTETSSFIHNEIRDKLADIGKWLGFKTRTEVKVADGSKVDTIWESEIGNLGRVIYVFEVQTKGSIDSLVMNLMKAQYNPAVQRIVAVTDLEQIEKIKKHISSLADFKNKIRFWDYKEVLLIYDNLETVNANINKLNLVPEGFK
ncbi:MAG: hypothetical protein NTU66_05960 [Elusimicrobia bacterium]|nr:hypothetical protein [Elusimicrobiota bacterium]